METISPAVVLEPVSKEQAPILQNLFELYAYDFSELLPLELKSSGRFEISPGEGWWTHDDHFPYFIHSQGRLIGFALVRRGSRVTVAPEVMDVAEFFVLRGARSKGVGRSAAHALFRQFPGAWEMRVRRSNPAAMQFWSRVVAAWSGGPVASTAFVADGVDWDALRIETSIGSVEKDG